MDKGKKHSDLTAEEIKQYLSGKTTSKAQHDVEKKLLNDAFAADATEGFDALKLEKIDEKASINDLKKRLNQRTQTNQKMPKIIPLWQSISVAASVLLVLSFSIYYFTYKTDSEPITSKESMKNTKKDKESTVLNESKKADLALNDEPKLMRENRRILPNKPTAHKEDLAEIPPPAQSETDNTKIAIKAEEEDATLAAPVPTPIEQKISVSAAPKPAPVLSEDAEVLAEIVVTEKQPKSKSSVLQIPIVTQLNQEPIPAMGWNKYDDYLINSLKKSGSVSTINFDEPLRLRLTVEPNGKPTNVVIENNLSKEQAESVVQIVEKGPKWFPARKKGRKVRKNIFRELKLK